MLCSQYWMILSIFSQTWCCTQLWCLATSSRASDSSSGSSTLHWALGQTIGTDDELQHIYGFHCVGCYSCRCVECFGQIRTFGFDAKSSASLVNSPLDTFKDSTMWCDSSLLLLSVYNCGVRLVLILYKVEWWTWALSMISENVLNWFHVYHLCV